MKKSALASETLIRHATHSWAVRLAHWINAVAILVLISSGLQIYNASPLFGFYFPDQVALGPWLSHALQWHFAMMWILLINTFLYLSLGAATGHIRKFLFPVTRKHFHEELRKLIALKHQTQPVGYNVVQRTAYLCALFLIVLLITSGVAIWKPVQLQTLTWLLGGYEGARIVHFLAMSCLLVFLIIHCVMAAIRPKAMLSMITGNITVRGKVPSPQINRHADIPCTNAGDAL